MVGVATRDDVARMISEGAQLLDVLPEQEFSETHLPGAINIPLKHLDADHVEALRRDRPVVVY